DLFAGLLSRLRGLLGLFRWLCALALFFVHGLGELARFLGNRLLLFGDFGEGTLCAATLGRGRFTGHAFHRFPQLPLILRELTSLFSLLPARHTLRRRGVLGLNWVG